VYYDSKPLTFEEKSQHNETCLNRMLGFGIVKMIDISNFAAELAVETAVVAEKGVTASFKRRALVPINYKELDNDDDDSMLDENRTKKKAVTSKKKKPKTTENAAASMTTTNTTTTTTMTTMVTNDITYSKRLAAEVKPDGKTWPGMKAEYWPHPNHPSYNWANPTYGRFFNDNGVEDENGLWQWRNSHEAWYRQ